MKLRDLLISIALLTFSHSFAQNTNLRGQVVTNYYYQQVPLVSAQVDLFIFDGRRAIGNQWILMGTTITDAYGYYFFRGVPTGPYTIWINRTKSYNINVYPIDYRYYSYQDLPQFIF